MRSTFCVLVLMMLTPLAIADQVSVRIAVIGDADNQPLAALLTTELSSSHNIILLERDDLAKVGDELKLQQLAGTDAIALGKLIGADGLIFISKGADGPEIRFTAVGLGYALFDDQFNRETDLVQWVPAIAHRVAGYVPKLKLDPAKAIPISVLNLRADYATPESTSLERKLTLLLESKLSSLPQYVVLERRHGWSLGFEHSLAADPKPLLQGAYVVDGTLSFPMQDQGTGDVTIHLRLRSPNNQQTPLKIFGPTTDLPNLVEKMVVEIQKATRIATAQPWQPEREAREYLEEGIWGWQHDADDAALEALDSAELLGEKAPDLVAVRIAVLSKRASVALDLAKKDSSGPVPESIPVDQMIDDTLRAIGDAARYDSEKMEPKLQLLTWQQNMDMRTDQIKENLANFTSDLLVFLDGRHSSRTDELRLALRAITGYDPLHGKLGRADMSRPLNVLTDSKDEWDLTLAEELAYYHLLATTPHQFIPPDLLIGQGKGFCHRFLKTPEEQKQAFDQFVHELKGDPKAQLTYQLILSCSPDDAVADAAYTAYWKEMWNQREELVSQKVQVEEWTSARPVPAALRRKHAHEMIPVLRFYLTHVNNYRDWEYSWETFWQPDQWSEADAAAIWADYLGFKQRAEADQVARGRNPLPFDEIEDPFREKFPQIAATTVPNATPEPLIVNRLWHPWLDSETSIAPTVILTQWQVVNDTLWIRAWFPSRDGDKHALIKLSISDFKAKVVPTPDAMNVGCCLAASSDAIYLYDNSPSTPSPSKPNHIARFDLKTETWETRTVDFSYEKCFAVKDSLYFDLHGGIGRYDWDTAKFTLLASCRRKPAQNQFDDCETYQINDIFAGPEGRPCASILQGGTFYIQDRPGNWPAVFDSSYWTFSTTRQEKTLVYCYNGEAVLLDPSQEEPLYLMSPTEPHYRKLASIHQTAVKQVTPWLGKTIWDATDALRFGSEVGADSEHFFLLTYKGKPESPAKSYSLLWYDKDHGRTPCVIPLQFHLDEKTYAALPSMDQGKDGERLSRDSFEHPGTICNLSLAAVKDGICLNSDDLGIWFIPYSDIETYLNTHPIEEPNPLTPGVAIQVRVPPPEDDAESQVIGDMIDPAIRAMSFR
jgi:hypothetical protein